VGYDEEQKTVIPFIGHLKDNTIQVNFGAAGIPYPTAPDQKDLAWRLEQQSGKDVLIIPTYGKNYETDEYSTYDMV